VFCYVGKVGGYDLMDFYYEALSSVDHKKGMTMGNIDLAAAGDHVKITMVPKADVERVSAAIRDQINAHRARKRRELLGL
jgi:Bacterial PH domain